MQGMILEEGSILRIKEKENIEDDTRKGTDSGIKHSDSHIFGHITTGHLVASKSSMKFP